MKELSIEQKAKRYDEAVEIAKKINNEQRAQPFNVMTRVFPELAESEDERIRKAISQCVEDMRGQFEKLYSVHHKDAIAWLEKQGNPTVIIPKFRVGDEIKTSNEESLTITKIDEKGYWSEDLFICNFDDADKWKLVEQKSAWSEEDEEIHRKCICAMRASACGFPEEEKFVEQVDNWLKSLKDRVQPKQEWSEEDEKKSLEIKCLIGNYRTGNDEYELCSWIDKFKNRAQSQSQPKQEWSGGDEAHLHSLITHLEQWIERHPNTTGADIQGENVAWLKSLKLKLKD